MQSTPHRGPAGTPRAGARHEGLRRAGGQAEYVRVPFADVGPIKVRHRRGAGNGSGDAGRVS